MKKVLFLFVMACFAVVPYSCQSSAGRFGVVSPDKALEVSVSKDSSGLYVYSFAAQGEELITASPVGFKGKHQGMIPDADWTVIFYGNVACYQCKLGYKRMVFITYFCTINNL